MARSRENFAIAAVLAVGDHGRCRPRDAKAQTSADKAFILGAGSTFAAPLYDSWIKAFVKDKPGVSINYDAVGSGEGISRFITGSVDFAGTDAPLATKRPRPQQGRVAANPRRPPG